jgi:hypothetical protein
MRSVGVMLWILALPVSGCAGTSRSGEAALSGQTPQVSFQVRAQARGTEEWAPLSAEDVIHSGDHLMLRVQTTAPVFLYVARAATDRPFTLLFPKEPAQALMLQPQKEYGVPSEAQGLELDSQVGEENFYLVASSVQLSTEKLQELITSAPAVETGLSRPRPPGLGNGNRGPASAADGASQVYLVKQLAPGLFAARFAFQHQQ